MNDIIGIANQASKEWLKEFPTPEETAHQVPKRFLEIFSKLVSEKAVEESNHIIYKSCINQPHWKRSAMRYLKRNAPMLHHQAVTEFNEHPDGRGKE